MSGLCQKSKKSPQEKKGKKCKQNWKISKKNWKISKIIVKKFKISKMKNFQTLKKSGVIATPSVKREFQIFSFTGKSGVERDL